MTDETPQRRTQAWGEHAEIGCHRRASMDPSPGDTNLIEGKASGPKTTLRDVVIPPRGHGIRVASMVLLAAVVVGVGCSSDPPGTAPDAGADDTGSLVDDTGGDGTGTVDTTTTPEGDTTIAEDVGPPEPGEYGSACSSDEDCRSRICVPDENGGICSAFCLTDCEPFYPDRTAFCRSDASTEDELAFVCYPGLGQLCAPCSDVAQCDGAPCLETDDGGRCGRLCESDDDCPTRTTCQDVEGPDGPVRSCVPTNGSCTCTEDNAGERRPCTQSNMFGSCAGEEVCEPEQGWSGCTAAEPAQEVCNGADENCNGIPDDGIEAVACQVDNAFGACPGTLICQGDGVSVCVGQEPAEEVCDAFDNDCDGMVDEGFADEQGRYTRLEHCGGCNQTCEGRFSFATEVACDGEREVPVCVVRACQEGYTLAGDSSCIPLTEATCLPCVEDADCQARSPGSACVTIGDPEAPETLAQVCGRDCAEGSVYGTTCDDGFSCTPLRDGAIAQCLPSGGTCLCVDNSDGFAIPCQVESPISGEQCTGRRSCVGDSFGDCALPEDLCNGFDDDCDGIVDNGLRDPDTGRYDRSPEHCGRCNNDCGALSFPNADGTCDIEAPTPVCVMR
ncbi:MAG: MopE-related protein, partial [Myxococcota bacterium]